MKLIRVLKTSLKLPSQFRLAGRMSGSLAGLHGRPGGSTRAVGMLMAVAASSMACTDRGVGPCAPVGRLDDVDGVRFQGTDGFLKSIGPEYFGFNIEGTEFELSLWDKARRRPHAQIVDELKAAFPGAVYRFPGGLVANVLHWKQATGPVLSRGRSRLVDWSDPSIVDFGVDEYRDFVRSVQGKSWFVTNLKGDLDRDLPIGVLAREAADLARQDMETPPSFLRWELGNELDRGDYLWPRGKYIERAVATVNAIRQVNPHARFVGMLQDFDAQSKTGVTSENYNTAVVKALTGVGVDEFEQHYYYDDPPLGPSIPAQLHNLCRARTALREAGRPDAGIWITEHGRWPMEQAGRPWKDVWHRTADMAAALGVADLTIAMTQVAQVRGVMLHALHAFTGPWPAFHPADAASSDARFVSAATFEALKVLRAAMQPHVVQGEQRSSNKAGYIGGYDSRVAVFRSDGGTSYGVWAVNRRSEPVPAELVIPALKGVRLAARIGTVQSPGMEDNNYDGTPHIQARYMDTEVTFDANGTARLNLPAISISGITLHNGKGDAPLEGRG